jgi:predicted transposase YdaD
MKTDKLFYRIFLTQPGILAELIPGIPPDCEFEYCAPVIKEQEFRHDGVLTPIGDDLNLPIVFLEAQMQPDKGFYGRYFAEVCLYLKQYNISRPCRGLIILKSRGHQLGSEIPYRSILKEDVQRLYLEDLLSETDLSPNLGILQLIVLPQNRVGEAAQKLLQNVENKTQFTQRLDLIEAILVSKFPQISPEEILKMLDLKTADITQTRFYRDVFQLGAKEGKAEGRQEGRQEGEAQLIIRQINRRCGVLSPNQEAQIRSLDLNRLESLGEALLDFTTIADLEAWLNGTHQEQ